MTRPRFLKYLLGLLTGLVSCHAFAGHGGMEGGGGKGLRCGNVVRLLDLYEAQLAGDPRPISSGNFDQDLRSYIYKISRQLSTPGIQVDAPGYLDQVMKKTYGLLSQVHDIPTGQTLPFTTDATLPKLPIGCSFVQIAINEVSQTSGGLNIVVYRDKSLWKMMPMIDQVALVIHEYTYWITRVFGETSSDDTRTLIGRLFSGLETFEMFSPIWNISPIIWCGGSRPNDVDSWMTYVAQETERGLSGVGFYFQALDGKMRSSRTRAFFPGLVAQDFLNGKPMFAVGSARSELLKAAWPITIQSGPGGKLDLKIANRPFANGACQAQ